MTPKTQTCKGEGVSPTSILGYGCTTATGFGVDTLWTALRSRKAHVQWDRSFARVPTRASVHGWPEGVGESTAELSQCERLATHVQLAWNEMGRGLDLGTLARISAGRRLGVIFASTKGCIEDVIWTERGPADLARGRDTLQPVLDFILNKLNLNPVRAVCVSNACASGLTALALAQRWIQRELVDDVAVVAADGLGAFVINGFQSLKVLATQAARPFSGDRCGFLLGEAAAVVLLSRHGGSVVLEPVEVNAEGYSVARPSHDGRCLADACGKLADLSSVDAVVAHGTATRANDAAENEAFATLAREFNFHPVITGTKWCIGHTLGVSSLLDTIAAAEILRRQEIFPLASTSLVDSQFSGNYLTANGDASEREAEYGRVLVTSSGFGGVHAAGVLRWSGDARRAE